MITSKEIFKLIFMSVVIIGIIIAGIISIKEGAKIRGVGLILPLIIAVKYLDMLVKGIRATLIKRSFKESISRIGALYKSGIYHFDEFTNKKKELIDILIKRGITPDKESFLLSLVPLLKEEILTQKELSLIKDSCNEIKSKFNIDILDMDSIKLVCTAFIIVAIIVAITLYFF
jgi:hypothetical protein